MRKSILKLSLGNSYFYHFSSQNRLAISLTNARKNDNIIDFQAYIIILDYLKKYIYFINNYIMRNFFFKVYFDGISFALKKWLTHIWITQASKPRRTSWLGCIWRLFKNWTKNTSDLCAMSIWTEVHSFMDITVIKLLDEIVNIIKLKLKLQIYIIIIMKILFSQKTIFILY